MRMFHWVVMAAVAGPLVLVGQAWATPLIFVGEGSGTSWSDAMTAGNVVPVNPNIAVGPGGGISNASMQFYTTQASLVEWLQPVLTPDINVSDGSENHQSLVMSWNPPAAPNPAALYVSQWDYVYDIDPDLTGTKIHFSLFPPPGIWDVSLELIDSSGRARGWFAPGPANVWNQLWLNPMVLGPQGPFLTFFQDPGFDITQVVAIRFDEAGMFSPAFPLDPTGNGLFWNAWNHVQVAPMIPEPGTGLLALFGAAGLLWRRRQTTMRVIQPTRTLH